MDGEELTDEISLGPFLASMLTVRSSGPEHLILEVDPNTMVVISS